MSGGASARTMYDRIVEMFKRFPTINWEFLKLFPIPPTAMVVQGEQTAFKMADGLAEKQQLEIEKLKIENEKAKGAVASAPPSENDEHSDEDSKPSDEHSDNDSKPSDEHSDSEPSDDEHLDSEPSNDEHSDSEDSKSSENESTPKMPKNPVKGTQIGGDQAGILFTKEECSFF
jgi:hypothetical protein